MWPNSVKTHALRHSKFYRRRNVKMCISGCLILLALTIFQIKWGTPGYVDFALRANILNGVVAGIKLKNLNSNSSKTYIWENPFLSGTAVECPESVWINHSEGAILANRRIDGTLHIQIIVRNLGHSGTFGYTYNEKPDEILDKADLINQGAFLRESTRFTRDWSSGENHLD